MSDIDRLAIMCSAYTFVLLVVIGVAVSTIERRLVEIRDLLARKEGPK